MREKGRILALRHGRTAWNLERRMQGLADVPLCEEGISRLHGLTIPARFGHYEWVSSPLRRCLETAALLGETAVRRESRIIEMNWGAWEGFSLAELRERDPVGMRENESRGLDFRPAGGESPREVADRLGPWLEQVGTAVEEIVMVSHKGVLSALLSRAIGWDMKDKAPVKLDWDRCQLFEVDTGGGVELAETNISLARSGE